MSLSGALSNAISGLTAASRSAGVVSSNLANVMTEGYARRDVELEAQIARGGGVSVVSTVRFRDPMILSEMRTATADRSASASLAGFYSKVEQLVGTPDDASSLTAKMADLEASLLSAASRPDLSGRLDQVVRDAQTVAQVLATASQGVQDARVAADRNIAAGVNELDAKFVQVQELNVQIAGGSVAKRDVSSLIDIREKLISEIAEWIPVKEMRRPNQGVALYSTGGVLLLDGSAAQLSFANAHTIVPHMTEQGGHLSGIAINGVDVSVDPQQGPLRGGKLAALFEIRDQASVAAQSELDAIARDLGERFQAAGLDATRATGDPGLFTDGGAFVDPANEVGLAGRLTVNAAVDSAQGGASWRLRDGLGAAAPGPVGNAELLQEMSDVLSARRSPLSGGYAGQENSASGLVGLLTSKFGAERLVAEQDLTFAATRATEAEMFLMEDGVDSDQEMQKLMLIEQAYAANARVLQTVDDMMNALMGAI
jgi:flagellar hook-associated protein 1